MLTANYRDFFMRSIISPNVMDLVNTAGASAEVSASTVKEGLTMFVGTGTTAATRNDYAAEAFVGSAAVSLGTTASSVTFAASIPIASTTTITEYGLIVRDSSANDFLLVHGVTAGTAVGTGKSASVNIEVAI